MKCGYKLFFLFFIIFICSCGKKNTEVNSSEIRNRISDSIFLPDLFIKHYNEYKTNELINNTRENNFAKCMVGLETYRQFHKAYFSLDLIKNLFGEPDYFRKGKIEGINLWLYTYNKEFNGKLSIVCLIEKNGIIIEIGFNSYDDNNFIKNENWKASAIKKR